MAKLTLEQKKRIIAERAEGATLEQLAKKYLVSDSTVHKVCKGDPAFKKKAEQKKRETEASVLKHMEAQRPRVNMILDDLLASISDKTKQQNSSLRDLATTMGILIDKFTSFETLQAGPGSLEDDPITKAIKESLKPDVKSKAD